MGKTATDFNVDQEKTILIQQVERIIKEAKKNGATACEVSS